MIRITGMQSGLDTDLIIRELMRGHRSKVDNLKRNQTTVQWRQDAWKDLNTRALRLHNMVGSLRFSDAFAKKTARVSNTNRASVIAGDNAVKGVQELRINQLARTGFLTGAKLDSSVNNNTRLRNLRDDSGNRIGLNNNEDINFTVKVGNRTTDISLNGDSTIQNVVSQLRNAGLNANFDASNGRFFISSQAMGEAGDFTITANNENALTALSAMGIYEHDASQYKHLEGLAGVLDANGEILNQAEWERLNASRLDSLIEKFTAELERTNENRANLEAKMEERIKEYKEYLRENDYFTEAEIDAFSPERVLEEISTINNALQDSLSGYQAQLDALEQDDPDYEEKKLSLEESINTANDKINELNYTAYDIQAFENDLAQIDALNERIGEINDRIVGAPAEAEESVRADIEFAQKMTNAATTGSIGGEFGLNRIKGLDAIIELNGAVFTSNTNTFNINGLTINAIQETEPGETLTITTEDDVSGIFDTISNFIKEYNALINEMDSLYNAASARDFRPLTEEEREAMSEREIEEWEKRIKDSLLRRDSSLESISSEMKRAMMSGVNVGGRNMFLSDFGISALSWFAAAPNEKNAYWIDGDPDSAHTSGKTNRLKEWIANDVQTVTDFFTGLSRNLYAAMDTALMNRNQFTSINSIYNDRQLQTEFDNLTKRIAEQEARVTKIEDKFYKQYSAMEVALARMQSSQNALLGLMGMNNNNR